MTYNFQNYFDFENRPIEHCVMSVLSDAISIIYENVC